MGESRFDPIAISERLLGPTGYEWSFSTRLCRSSGRWRPWELSSLKLRTAIECLLVGFDEPAERLLKLALEWVRVSIDSNERPERYFPDGTEALSYHTKALCNWLLLNWHDSDSFHHFVEYEDRWLGEFHSRSKDKTVVSFVLPTYVDAGAFERALELFRISPASRRRPH